jgi:hypothetical protein
MFIPDRLPAQCEEATQVDALNGKKIQPFGNWSPRLGATYDLLGNGKTSVHASGSYYYATKITLANSLTGLFSVTTLTWGPNLASGACSTASGAPCWNDANMDTKVQLNELIGEPRSNSSRFNATTGVFAPAGNIVDPSTKIGRVREGIVGVSHELIPNLALGVDYIYRKYDRGTINYTIGYEPGAAGYPLSSIYRGPLIHTDPATGLSAPYYVVCDGCARPSGLGNITLTSPNYTVYQGVDITATKRYSNRWQMQVAVTLQDSPQYFPEGTPTNFGSGASNPTRREFAHGFNTDRNWVFKANGAYTFPWDITAAANLNVNQGVNRTTLINGPGAVYGGTTGTISYGTLELEPRGSTRLASTKILDLSVQKTFSFNGGKRRLKLLFDAFNVYNVNTVTQWASQNRSLSSFTAPNTIVPPRVFRVGAQIGF